MNDCRTIRESTCRAILYVLVLAFVSSGIPLAEVHSHENAFFGHSHNHPGYNVGDHELDELTTDDSTHAAEALHVHDVNAPALTLMPEFDVDAVSIWTDTPVPIPPQFRPPENVIAPLYRPPIA